ncbi:MAG: Gfo/Idh/MocA family oxidoreductase [Candidatus Hydrogenedentes bacterium]|nr:Gfo/Idh/MocA family oxidoreductase [Candidatus Hydrogenedentota bacterium]
MSSVVRWGILSTARIGKALLQGIGDSTGNCVQAVSSREWTRASEWAKEHGVPRAFGSYEDMLQSGEISAVYNPLPNSMHAEWTIKALEAGLPVLCEKPFTLNAEEARRVAAVAKRKNLPVAEAFMYRYHPIYERLLETIEAGAIGGVMSIRSAFTFRLEDRNNIRWKKELGGGALMDIGCYCVSLSRLVTGKEPLRVAAVERRSDVDGTIIGVLEFPGNVLAHFECSFEQYGRSFAEIEGTEGLIILKRPWFPGEQSAEFFIRRGEHEERVSVPGANTYRLEVEDFGHACQTRKPPRWSIDDAIANMSVIDSLYKSAREHHPVEVP